MTTRVLSVEDDADLQRLLAISLAAEDFDLHYAGSGPEGFEKAVSLLPDVMLVDMMLPGYHGPELIKRLRAEPKTRKVPIVVMTAFYDTASLVEAEVRRLGVIEYMRKPVRMSDLVKILKRLDAKKR